MDGTSCGYSLVAVFCDKPMNIYGS